MSRRLRDIARGLILAAALAIGLTGLMPVWSDQTVEARASWSEAWGSAQAYAQQEPGPAPAVSPAPATPAAPNWALVWVPIVATVLTAIFKVVLPSIPKPAIPFLCIVLGALVDAINAWTTGGSANPITMLIMGPIGIGLREMLDQAKKSVMATG